MRFAFSTDAFEPAGRFEAFRDALARGLFAFDLAQRGTDPYRGVVDLCIPGPVVFGQVFGSAAEFTRSPALARGCEDGVWVLLTRTGRMRIAQGEVRRDLGPGEGAIIDARRAHAGECLVESDTWVVQVPGAELRALRPGGAALETSFLPSGAAATGLMFGLLEAHRRSGAMASAGLGAVTARSLADLVAFAMGPSARGAATVRERGLQAARRQAVLDDIAGHSLEAGFGAASIARRLGITPRYVHALLEDTGRSLSEHVLDRRLALARRALTGPDGETRRIADVAYACGFGDLSYFNRMFRRQFGQTPSEARAGVGTSQTVAR
ncbi:MAG: helix-turn-helix domain-containing protein [Reyranella sp.]|nr:helix-turn-helix domain-containing protein [Reyranella sp.]